MIVDELIIFDFFQLCRRQVQLEAQCCLEAGCGTPANIDRFRQTFLMRDEEDLRSRNKLILMRPRSRTPTNILTAKKQTIVSLRCSNLLVYLSVSYTHDCRHASFFSPNVFFDVHDDNHQYSFSFVQLIFSI